MVKVHFALPTQVTRLEGSSKSPAVHVDHNNVLNHSDTILKISRSTQRHWQCCHRLTVLQSYHMIWQVVNHFMCALFADCECLLSDKITKRTSKMDCVMNLPIYDCMCPSSSPSKYWISICWSSGHETLFMMLEKNFTCQFSLWNYHWAWNVQADLLSCPVTTEYALSVISNSDWCISLCVSATSKKILWFFL